MLLFFTTLFCSTSIDSLCLWCWGDYFQIHTNFSKSDWVNVAFICLVFVLQIINNGGCSHVAFLWTVQFVSSVWAQSIMALIYLTMLFSRQLVLSYMLTYCFVSANSIKLQYLDVVYRFSLFRFCRIKISCHWSVFMVAHCSLNDNCGQFYHTAQILSDRYSLSSPLLEHNWPILACKSIPPGKI